MKLFSSSGKYSNKSRAKAPRRSPEPEVRRTPVSNSRDTTRVGQYTPAPVNAAAPNEAPRVAANVSAQRARVNKRKAAQRRKRRILTGALAIFLAILIGTLLYFGLRKFKAQKDFQKIAENIQEIENLELVEPVPDEEPVVPTDPVSDSDQTTVPTEPEETEPEVKTILPKYAEYYQRNPEFYGWIRMDGTNVDYPVMRSFEDNDEYLYANFDGHYSYSGIPFVDYQCSEESDNLLIYGHNMKDGTMFRDIINYENESYWKEHPTFMYSDLYQDYEYEVVAAFYDRVYYKTETCFKFYQFIDAENEEDFDYAISQFKEKSIYDTGVDVQYGDKLVTLITCAYHVENGRFVVVARRK